MSNDIQRAREIALEAAALCAARITKLEAQRDALAAALYGYQAAVQNVLDNWSRGDLARAINNLESFRDNEAECALRDAGLPPHCVHVFEAGTCLRCGVGDDVKGNDDECEE
jgi:hypothetical protein